MTLETSPLYAKFLPLLEWCDRTWANAIQAGQRWMAQMLGCSIRHVKRMVAAARRDGFIKTQRRWHRTNVTTVLGGRHDAQMSLFDTQEEVTGNQWVAPPCPHSVPTVVCSTLRVRTVYSTLIVTKVKEVFRGWKRRKTPDELQDELIAGMLEGLC